MSQQLTLEQLNYRLIELELEVDKLNNAGRSAFINLPPDIVSSSIIDNPITGWKEAVGAEMGRQALTYAFDSAYYGLNTEQVPTVSNPVIFLPLVTEFDRVVSNDSIADGALEFFPSAVRTLRGQPSDPFTAGNYTALLRGDLANFSPELQDVALNFRNYLPTLLVIDQLYNNNRVSSTLTNQINTTIADLLNTDSDTALNFVLNLRQIDPNNLDSASSGLSLSNNQFAQLVENPNFVTELAQSGNAYQQLQALGGADGGQFVQLDELTQQNLITNSAFYQAVQSSPELFNQLVSSPALSQVIGDLFVSDEVRQIISDLLLDVNEEASFGDRVSGPLAEAIDHAVTGRLEQYGIILPEIQRTYSESGIVGSTQLIEQEYAELMGYIPETFGFDEYRRYLDFNISTLGPDGLPVDPISLFTYQPQETALYPGFWHIPGDNPDSVFSFRDQQIVDIVMNILEQYGLINLNDEVPTNYKRVNGDDFEGDDNTSSPKQLRDDLDTLKSENTDLKYRVDAAVADVSRQVGAVLNTISNNSTQISIVKGQLSALASKIGSLSQMYDEINRPLDDESSSKPTSNSFNTRKG